MAGRFTKEESECLFRSVKAGDSGAWVRLERLWSGTLVRRFSFRFPALTRDRIQEAVHDTFITLVTGCHAFETAGDLWRYLNEAVRHELIKEKRRLSLSNRLELERTSNQHVKSAEDCTHEAVYARELVARFLVSLSQQDREIFQSLAFEKPTVVELATRLGLSARTVKRKRSKLRDRFLAFWDKQTGPG